MIVNGQRTPTGDRGETGRLNDAAKKIADGFGLAAVYLDEAQEVARRIEGFVRSYKAAFNKHYEEANKLVDFTRGNWLDSEFIATTNYNVSASFTEATQRLNKLRNTVKAYKGLAGSTKADWVAQLGKFADNLKYALEQLANV